MTANGSSSSATGLSDLDLVASQRLPPIPRAFLAGEHEDLLAPLRFLRPDDNGVVLPDGEPATVDRKDLADGLAAANEGYGHPRAEALAAKLADPATRVVVTGQQAGIYGGPLLALTKMVAAVRWAEALEASGHGVAEQSAVAVFWIATEDHDWAEATKMSVMTREGAQNYDLGDDPAHLRPMGDRLLGNAFANLVERLRQDLGDAALEMAGRHYHPEASFGDAFAGFFTELLGERAPLFLDSQLPALKKAQQPWLRRLVEQRREIDTALTAAVAELERRDLPTQVRFRPGDSPLFFVANGERRRIEWRGVHGYALRGTDEEHPIDHLFERLEEDPACLSPGVLCRPALQDATLGTTLQIMGPAETSYLTQASAVYRTLGIDGPWTTLRPQVMVVEERQQSYLGELGVDLDELLGTPIDQILADRLHDDFVAPVRDQINDLFESLRAPVLEVEQQLEKPFNKTRDQVGRALDQLSGRITAAVGRRNEVWQRRLQQARDQVLPDNHLQERHLSVLHYVARYGPEFAEMYWNDDFNLDPRFLQILSLRPMPSGGVS